MDKFGKIHRHHWKERLKVESDLLKANEDTDVCMVGGGGGGGGAQTCLPPYELL